MVFLDVVPIAAKKLGDIIRLHRCNIDNHTNQQSQIMELNCVATAKFTSVLLIDIESGERTSSTAHYDWTSVYKIHTVCYILSTTYQFMYVHIG